MLHIHLIFALQKREHELRKTRMAEALMIENNHRDFRKEGKKVEGRSKTRAPHIDDKITPMDIADLFFRNI